MISIEQSSQNSKSMSSDDDESALLDDVKVCDICGDAGREDLLAVCSKCGDGAEHIYCMRTMLEKVPDNSWMCEECVLSEDKHKASKAKMEQFIAYGRQNSLNQTCRSEGLSRGSGRRIHAQLNSTALVNRSSREKVSAPSSPERISNNQISALTGRPKAVGSQSKPSSIAKDGKGPYPQNLAIKPGHELSSRARNMQEDATFSSLSGNFTKSKSFSGSDKRVKVLRLDEIPQNQRKVSTGRAFRKSVSFNDAISGRSNADGQKLQRIPPNTYEDRDLKRLRTMKEHDSVEISKKSQFSRPHLSSQGNGSSISASPCDIASTLRVESKSTEAFGTKIKDKDVFSSKDKDDVIQSSQTLTSSGASEEILHRGENSDISLAKVPMRSSSAIGEDALASPKESVSILDGAMVKDKSGSDWMDLASPSYKPLAILAFPKLDYIWRGEFEIQSGRLPKVLYRIQAHLSTLASPSIPEAVKKFSDKVLLEEVSRLNAWPAQFQEHYPQDKSIGLYFFAEDTTSYGNYKSLLHCMTDQDLALRGNLNGIEVLIFSSNLLPEGSKLWNGFLFLWGVFKVQKGQKLQPS
ncbi:OLC1v1031306C1 [Oldenlandia corymbosa var. corymbosa]|uniref:OLC1v1031306C1 n=1 Tax=Oldenlandia corymbosa var. corymbosa TaxID=529605 RepID=A0AAV1CIA2_OLDCO|nr:OLC1v1031306C1 [Oldenlandia corymbosa var. corymbosa]